jgi:hypothetical protein
VAIEDIRRKPIPIKNPHAVITILGPNLSVKRPTAILAIPNMIKEIEYAAEVAALVQSSSDEIGFKKTPKVLCEPMINKELTKLAATIT